MTQAPNKLPNPVKGTLLLVDADPASLESETKLLAALGYGIVPATDGNHALRVLDMKFQRHPPVLMVVDVALPQLSGFEFVRRIREKFDARKVPVILLSKHRSREDELELANVGAQALLAKPMTSELLNSALELIEQKKQKPTTPA